MTRIAGLGLIVFLLTACGPAPEASASPDGQTAGAAQAASGGPWEATQAKYRDVETAPTDPLEALEWRATGCFHLGGEIGGDGSERDQEVQARMASLRCDAVADEARAMREARAADAAVAARLTRIIENLG